MYKTKQKKYTGSLQPLIHTYLVTLTKVTIMIQKKLYKFIEDITISKESGLQNHTLSPRTIPFYVHHFHV